MGADITPSPILSKFNTEPSRTASAKAEQEEPKILMDAIGMLQEAQGQQMEQKQKEKEQESEEATNRRRSRDGDMEQWRISETVRPA